MAADAHPSPSTQSDARGAVIAAVAGIRNDLDRARDVVRDAIATLLTSFYGLQRSLEAQRDDLHVLMGELVNHRPDQSSLAQVTEATLGGFVDELVRVSRDSMRLVEQLETMQAQVEEIVSRTRGIEKIARETRFIALNARIETHRAGDAGRTFKLVAEEVKRLAHESGNVSEAIRSVVGKTQVTLNESRETAGLLASHDMSNAISSHNRLTEAVRKFDGINRKMGGTLEEVAAHVASAIRALQFEDMVSQLIEATKSKMETFGQVVNRLVDRSVPGVGPSERDLKHMIAVLRDLAVVGAVTQTSMSTGSVDLF